MVTLRQIITLWNHPELKILNHTYRYLFPDVYKVELTSNRCYGEAQRCFETLGESERNKFLKGNKRIVNGKRYYWAAFLTKDLKRHLLGNAFIQYREELTDAPMWTAKENMLENIREYVQSTYPVMDNSHILFQEIPVTEELFYDQELVETLKHLIEENSESSISYAIFLLLLTAIYQENIVELKVFYKKEAMEQQWKEEKQILEGMDVHKDDKACTYFNDTAYMNEYNAYVYNESNHKLYYFSKLKMEIKEDGIPKATLFLQTNPTGQRSTVKKYVGTPILCKADQLVWISFVNEENLVAFLYFKYDVFHYLDMYYRTAFFIMSSPGKKIPQVQKVAITSRKLEDADMPLVRGVLKMTGKTIFMSEKQLQGFLEEFKQAPWMEEFQDVFFPFIVSHKREYYVFSESEILSYSLSSMGELERVRMLEALKAKAEGEEVLTCEVPEKLHRVMNGEKEGEKNENE